MKPSKNIIYNKILLKSLFTNDEFVCMSLLICSVPDFIRNLWVLSINNYDKWFYQKWHLLINHKKIP